jgi:hypothetical protein
VILILFYFYPRMDRLPVDPYWVMMKASNWSASSEGWVQSLQMELWGKLQIGHLLSDLTSEN